MVKRKVIHVLSSIEKSLAFEWLLPRLAREFDLLVILLNAKDTPLETFLRTNGIACHRFTFTGRRDFLPVFFRLLMTFLRLRPEVVHVHLLDAQRLALPAAWLAGIRRRIYTRHNSTLHHRYYPSGVKYDNWSNWLCTDIVSLSQATDYVLFELEGVPQAKVTRIPHGFDFSSMEGISAERVAAVRKKWGIPSQRFVIGLVSRFMEWKGLQYALVAIANFQKANPDTHLVVANAQGPYAAEINSLLADFSNGSVTMIPFEEDSTALFSLFDIFVHVPIDKYVEAFGQVYIEALALGVPSIFTKSGVADEFVEDEIHALVVDYQNADAIENAMVRYRQDESLRKRVSLQGKLMVKTHFGIDVAVTQFKNLYHG